MRWLPALLVLCLADSILAADWTQFRGPAGQGVSEDKGLPLKWSATEGLRWKAPLPGRGLSNPVIVGNRILVTASSGYREPRLHVLCFDATTGSRLWERQFASTGNTACHPKTCMAAPTPVSDGKAVYALFATADLVALDLNGDLLWYRSLVQDYPTITNQVGMAASPALYRDTLVIPMENLGDSFVAGIDTRTGKNKWKVDRPHSISWVSPVVVEVGEKPTLILQTPTEVAGHDPADGSVRWSLSAEEVSTIPSVATGGGLIFIPGKQLMALKPAVKDGTPEVLWKTTKLATAGYPSPLYHDGRIYSLTTIGITCGQAKDGEVVWQQRIKGPFAGCPVIGDGKLYVVNEEGTTTVLKLGDKPEVLATNALGDTILATPAISHGALYLRSDKFLYCIGEKR